MDATKGLGFSAKDTVISIGVFDGIHVGHVAVIKQLVKRSKEKNALSAIVTFIQPLEALKEHKLPVLTSLNTRLRIIHELGVDTVIPIAFSQEIADLDVRDFVTMLQKRLKMRGLVLGRDATVGRNRGGDSTTLQALGSELGFDVEVVDPLEHEGKIVSSTAIRQALAAGDLKLAQTMLGRPFSLEGSVVPGDKIGRQLGFPTANLAFDSLQALPVNGVYAAYAHFEGQAKPAAAFVGKRATFGGLARVVEVHVLDFSGDLYGKDFGVDILERIRDEEKFSSVTALKEQISKDIITIRKKLALVQ